MKVMGAFAAFENNYIKFDKDKKVHNNFINANDTNEVDKKKPFDTKFSQSYLLQRNLLSLKKYPFKNGRISFGKPVSMPKYYSSGCYPYFEIMSTFDLLKHAKYTDISEMYERDETKRKEELRENKAIRAKNFRFLDNIRDSLEQGIFVIGYKKLTGFPNLKECSQKIKDEFERTICAAEKNVNEMFKNKDPHAADVIMYGYDDMCSVGLGHAWPGSDLDKAYVIIKGSSSYQLSDEELVNQFRGQLWENMDQRILSINHFAAFPNVYTKKQVLDMISTLDLYTGNFTELDEMAAQTAINHAKDPILRAQFNLELAEKLPVCLREDAKNFAYLIEPIRECGRSYRIDAKDDDEEIINKISSSRFCQMSNVSGLRYYHNKQKESSELKPKLKARENVEMSFDSWDIRKQYDFIKNVIKNMCGDGEPNECFECPDGTRELMMNDMLTGRIPIKKYPKFILAKN